MGDPEALAKRERERLYSARQARSGRRASDAVETEQGVQAGLGSTARPPAGTGPGAQAALAAPGPDRPGRGRRRGRTAVGASQAPERPQPEPVPVVPRQADPPEALLPPAGRAWRRRPRKSHSRGRQPQEICLRERCRTRRRCLQRASPWWMRLWWMRPCGGCACGGRARPRIWRSWSQAWRSRTRARTGGSRAAWTRVRRSLTRRARAGVSRAARIRTRRSGGGRRRAGCGRAPDARVRGDRAGVDRPRHGAVHRAR